MNKTFNYTETSFSLANDDRFSHSEGLSCPFLLSQLVNKLHGMSMTIMSMTVCDCDQRIMVIIITMNRVVQIYSKMKLIGISFVSCLIVWFCGWLRAAHWVVGDLVVQSRTNLVRPIFERQVL